MLVGKASGLSLSGFGGSASCGLGLLFEKGSRRVLYGSFYTLLYEALGYVTYMLYAHTYHMRSCMHVCITACYSKASFLPATWKEGAVGLGNSLKNRPSAIMTLE